MDKEEKLKILSIVGARPQFIKEFPIHNQLKNSKEFEEVLVHTGQHYDYEMSLVFFEELNIPKPDYHLGVGSGTHSQQSGKIMERLEKVLMKEKPSLVLVYGDTNTTLAGALSSTKLNIPVAHIEAGLRSFNKKMPEEINRILTDHISTFLFCPTKTAIENLKKEGIVSSKIKEKYVYLVGDVMEEALSLVLPKVEKGKKILGELNLKEKKYLLITIHRAENTDTKERLEKIFKILEKLSKDFEIVLPIHPRTKKQIEKFKIKVPEKLRIINPLSYIKMLSLEKNAHTILTDSGGVQKEAYWFSVPCLTLRRETEWIETLESGLNKVVDLNFKKIKEGLNNSKCFKKEKKKLKSYASKKIVEILKKMHFRKINKVYEKDI